MALYDPIERFGTTWRTFGDGSHRRVIISGGRYCFQDQDTEKLTAIPNTISPQGRSTPRSTQGPSQARLEAPVDNLTGQNEPQIEHRPRPHSEFELQGSGIGGRRYDPAVADDAGRGVPLRTRRPSENHERSRASTASCPSNILGEFIHLPYGDFPAIRSFIDTNKDILCANLQNFIDAAVSARQNRDDTAEMRSQRCIQCYVIIKACKNFSTSDRDDYFDHLERRDKNEYDYRRYVDDFQRALSQVQQQLQAGSRSQQERLPTALGPQGLNSARSGSVGYSQPLYTGYGVSTNLLPNNAYVSTSSTAGYHQQTTSAAAPRLVGPSVTGGLPLPSQTTSRTSGQPQAAHGMSMQVPSTISRNNAGHPQELTPFGQQLDAIGSRPTYLRPLNNDHLDHEYKHKPPTAGGIQNVQFRGDEQLRDSNRLDDRYTLRTDASKFFKVGRVFSMMFHEGMGLKHRRLPDAHPEDDDDDDPQVTEGPKGVKIYSHIRRMAVIRQRDGYCVCVPISSYRRRGTGKKKLKDSEVQAHTIAYPSYLQDPPKPLHGEPTFWKRPIAIDLCKGQELNYASRIHFGKFYTIEWNIKVMNVGCIAAKSMADFETYWNQELTAAPPQ